MTQKLHPHSAARGLASLGRHGDSTLVHMSPQEVQGLQNLALRHGTSLTVNPQTGLPEAFSLSKLLPMLGGAALAFVAPELVIPAAVAAGGVKKAEGGSWMDAIGTGLQVYGGAGLASGLAGAGAAEGAGVPEAVDVSAGGAGATGASAAGTEAAGAAALPEGITQVNPTTYFDASTGEGFQVAARAPVGEVAQGVTQVNPTTYFDASTGEGFQTAASGAGADAAKILPPESGVGAEAAKVLAPSQQPIMMTPEQTAADRFAAAKEGASSLKGWGAAAKSLNTPQMLGIGSGVMEAAKQEPNIPEAQKPVYYIQKPGGPSLYEPGTINPNIAKLGYIPTGQKAFEGQRFNEGVYSYSPTKYEPVANMRAGGLASLKRMADGGSTGGGAVPQSTGQQILASSAPPSQMNAPAPAQNPLQGLNDYFGNQATAAFNQPSAAPQNMQAQNTSDWISQFNQSLAPQATQDAQASAVPTLRNSINAYLAKPETMEALRNQALREDIGQVFFPTSGYVNKVVGRDPSDTSGYALSYAAGGLAGISNTYAAGGKLLKGPGDGMSDSIPAVINGQKPQRAALADGEFVVPADVVSHLGNGSTEAGSRKLYGMMDKIRKARTGKAKQAPAVKADKYLPA